jgi:hypothetical protein
MKDTTLWDMTTSCISFKNLRDGVISANSSLVLDVVSLCALYIPLRLICSLS